MENDSLRGSAAGSSEEPNQNGKREDDQVEGRNDEDDVLEDVDNDEEQEEEELEESSQEMGDDYNAGRQGDSDHDSLEDKDYDEEEDEEDEDEVEQECAQVVDSTAQNPQHAWPDQENQDNIAAGGEDFDAEQAGMEYEAIVARRAEIVENARIEMIEMEPELPTQKDYQSDILRELTQIRNENLEYNRLEVYVLELEQIMRIRMIVDLLDLGGRLNSETLLQMCYRLVNQETDLENLRNFRDSQFAQEEQRRDRLREIGQRIFNRFEQQQEEAAGNREGSEAGERPSKENIEFRIWRFLSVLQHQDGLERLDELEREIAVRREMNAADQFQEGQDFFARINPDIVAEGIPHHNNRDNIPIERQYRTEFIQLANDLQSPPDDVRLDVFRRLIDLGVQFQESRLEQDRQRIQEEPQRQREGEIMDQLNDSVKGDMRRLNPMAPGNASGNIQQEGAGIETDVDVDDELEDEYSGSDSSQDVEEVPEESSERYVADTGSATNQPSSSTSEPNAGNEEVEDPSQRTRKRGNGSELSDAKRTN